MRNLFRVSLIAAACLAGTSSATAAVYTPSPLPECSPPSVTQECIVSVTQNGTPITISRTTGPVVTFGNLSEPGTHPVPWPFISVMLNTNGPVVDLDPADVWSVTLNTGALRPAQLFGRMSNMRVTRGGDATGGYTLTVTGQPVRMAYTDTGCGGTGVCPTTADTLNTGVFSFELNDARYYTNPDHRLAVRGFDFAASTDWVSSPPQLDLATNTIRIDVANAHFEPDGTTVFTGSAALRFPNAMLNQLYDIDDPAALTPSVFAVSSGGAPSVITTVAIEPDGVRVRLGGLTFSKRALRVQSRPVPTRIRKPFAGRRLSSTTGRISFISARSRGSKVRSYRASCFSGGHKVLASALRSPITVRNLRPGREYGCYVRAISKAGASAPTKVVVRAG